MTINIHRLPEKNFGFSLIEVLISMLIIAVGLLGVAALQFRGLQYSHDAFLRSQVTVLAYDMADRMRLNRANVATYDGLVTNYVIPATPRPGPCNNTGPATAANANNDVVCWQQQLFDSLPPGTIVDIAANGNIYTIRVTWQSRDGMLHNVPFSFNPL